MWKLTIKQTTKRKYEEKEYDHPEEVVLRCNSPEAVLDVQATMMRTATMGKTEFIVEREVEEHGTENV